MKKSTKIKIEDKSDTTLAVELAAATLAITEGIITFFNASKVKRDCPWAAFNHTGRVIVDNEKDPVTFEQAMTVVFKVRDEESKAGNVTACKANKQFKADTLSTVIRTAGMKASDCPVLDQLAACQRTHQVKRAIENEQADRKVKAELKAKADALSAMQYGPTIVPPVETPAPAPAPVQTPAKRGRKLQAAA